jgi:predicted ATP-dependent serine protease
MRAGPHCPHCGEEAVVFLGGEEDEGAAPPDGVDEGAELEDDEEPFEVEDLDGVEPLRLTPCTAPLVAPLGGVPSTGAVVLLTGVPGAGKSTEAVRLAVELGEAPIYCDREMMRAQCAALFERVNAPASFVRQTKRITGGTWRQAFAYAAEARQGGGARILIVDSLHEWAGELESERKALMMRARRLADAGLLVVVIAHYARAGHVSGGRGSEHRADAVLVVRHDEIEISKCRWSPARGSFPRDGAAPRPEPKAAPRARTVRTPWEILGIPKGSAEIVVKAAWRKLAAEYHPDKVAHLGEELRAVAAARMVEINGAYQTLRGA